MTGISFFMLNLSHASFVSVPQLNPGLTNFPKNAGLALIARNVVEKKKCSFMNILKRMTTLEKEVEES